MEESNPITQVAIIILYVIAAIALGIGLIRGLKEVRFGYRRWALRRMFRPNVVVPQNILTRIQAEYDSLPAYPDRQAVIMDNRFLKEGDIYGEEVSLVNVDTSPSRMQVFAGLMAEQGWEATPWGRCGFEFRKPGWRVTVDRWTHHDLIFQVWLEQP